MAFPITKADDIIDGWRTLEKIRVMANRTYAARSGIKPDYDMHENQPGLNVYNIYDLLPKTNCGICGQKTCMAFAYELWSRNALPLKCEPAFLGEYQHLKNTLLEACISMGISLDNER